MHDNLNNHLNLDELAAEHNVSYTWFRKAFKEVIGVSPGQYLLNFKLEKTCKLRKETGLTVAEIAFEMNISPSLFKKESK